MAAGDGARPISTRSRTIVGDGDWDWRRRFGEEPRDMDMEQTAQLVLPPIRALIESMPGLEVHADPYSGPFQSYHYQITHAQTWDLVPIKGVVDARGGPVLDVGCGAGRLALPLARDGHDVTAVDTSTSAIARLRDVLASEPEVAARMRVVCGDVTNADSVPARRFRVVAMADFSINIFATTEALGSLLGAVERALAEDGVLCLPVLRKESLEHFTRLRGMMAVPFVDDAGRQRLLWIVLNHEHEGPYFSRTFFIQDDNAEDGTVTGHVTAVRERVWTPDTLLPHISAAGLEVVQTQPLQVPTALGPDLQATLMIIQRGPTLAENP
jgi:SAM-dependent methyltransferase